MARRSDHTRDEIREMAIQAAERIVGLEGYQGLSARKVAAEIGYTVGTLYLVFDKLEDLIFQVNGRTLDVLYDRMSAAMAGCASPYDCVSALARAYIDFALEHPKRWGMIYEHVLPEGEKVPANYQAKVERLFGLVEESVKPLAQRHPRREVAQAARVLWGAVHGICMLKLTNKLDVAGEDSAHELVEVLIRRFLQGFG
jgi:AcrR family transcriptional regulator